MRAVIDTNIFVGACLGVGSTRKVIEACLRGQIQPVMGEALCNEFEDVLSRDRLYQNSRLTKSERSNLLDIFLAKCEWVRIYHSWRPNLRDEADNHLIELAIAGGARSLIRRNSRDFRNADLRFDGIIVCDPDTILREFGL